MSVEISCDGRYFAVKQSSESALVVWNTHTGECTKCGDSDVTCFSWSADGQQLAIGSSSGTVKILYVTTGALVHTFNQISTNAIRSLLFFRDNNTNFLCTIDASSNVIISNTDKPVPKLHFYTPAAFSKLKSPLRQALRTHTSTQQTSSHLLYVVSETHLGLFNYANGTLSKKPPTVPGVQDSDLVTGAAFGGNVVVRSDKQTVVRYGVGGKAGKVTHNSSITVNDKKRFQTNLTSISQSEAYTTVTEIDGTLHLINTADKGQSLKVKIRQAAPKTGAKRSKLASSILFAQCSQKGTLTVAYGASWSTPIFEEFEIAELFALSTGEILVLERDSTLRPKKEEKADVVATITTGAADAEFDEIGAGKRKKYLEDANDKIVTIGDTLEERLEGALKIKSDAMTDGDADEAVGVSASDKSTTLAQALHAGDATTIDNVLKSSTADSSIIQTTVSALPKSFLSSLINALESRIRSKPEEAATALQWLKVVLREHPSYVLANSAKTQKSMLKIHEMSIQKRKYSECLSRLQGRLGFFLKQDQTDPSKNLKTSIGEGAVTAADLPAQFVYEADDDEVRRIVAQGDGSSSEDDFSDSEGEFDDDMEDGDDKPFFGGTGGFGEGEEVEASEPDVSEGDEMVDDSVDLKKADKLQKRKVRVAAKLLGTPDNSDDDTADIIPVR